MDERKCLETWDVSIAPALFNKFPPVVRDVLRRIELPQIKVTSTYIWGGVGCGKTILAASLIVQACKHAYTNYEIWPSWFLIPVPELLFEFKQGYDSKVEGQRECDILEKYASVDLLVLDDFGVEKSSEWAFQLLYILINRRYENNRLTVYTSNFPLDRLAQRMGDDRITSRIQGTSTIIEKTGNDYRAN